MSLPKWSLYLIGFFVGMISASPLMFPKLGIAHFLVEEDSVWFPGVVFSIVLSLVLALTNIFPGRRPFYRLLRLLLLSIVATAIYFAIALSLSMFFFLFSFSDLLLFKLLIIVLSIASLVGGVVMVWIVSMMGCQIRKKRAFLQVLIASFSVVICCVLYDYYYAFTDYSFSPTFLGYASRFNLPYRGELDVFGYTLIVWQTLMFPMLSIKSVTKKEGVEAVEKNNAETVPISPL